MPADVYVCVCVCPQADDAGGALQDAFLRGTLALEPFVEQYVASRTAYHALDLKRQTGDNSQYAQ